MYYEAYKGFFIILEYPYKYQHSLSVCILIKCYIKISTTFLNKITFKRKKLTKHKKGSQANNQPKKN